MLLDDNGMGGNRTEHVELLYNPNAGQIARLTGIHSTL